LSVGDVLLALSEAGLTLTASKIEDTLKVYPAENITAELADAIRAHKPGIIRILRDDEEMRRTGIIQSERQVFELACEHFGFDRKGGKAWGFTVLDRLDDEEFESIAEAVDEALGWRQSLSWKWGFRGESSCPMPRCSAIKANGERCAAQIVGRDGLCHAHSPLTAEARKSAHRPPGPAAIAREVREVLEKLEAGELERGVVAVMLQGHNVLARLAKLDHEMRETAELRREVRELRDELGLGA
jgi:hypothetical protein